MLLSPTGFWVVYLLFGVLVLAVAVVGVGAAVGLWWLARRRGDGDDESVENDGTGWERAREHELDDL